MFSFSEELKWYEPGLEIIEDSLSGNTQKDLVELIQTILKVQQNLITERQAEETNPDQMVLEEAAPVKEADPAELTDIEAEPGDDEE